MLLSTLSERKESKRLRVTKIGFLDTPTMNRLEYRGYQINNPQRIC
jgi:hypothetical protein